MSRPDSRRLRGDLLAWSVIAVLFTAPLATLGAGAAIQTTNQAKGTPAPEPIFMKVERTESLDAQPVTAALTWSDGLALKAPAWSGLVAEIGVKPGDVVRAGTRIVRVDGQWRVAAPTRAPFYAPVSSDSSATEVKALNALLRGMGYDAQGDTWSWRTTAAVREFAHGIGVPNADEVSAMDPSWLVWSPESEMTVGSMPVTVGASAPAQGEVVLTGPARLTRVVITAEEGASLPEVDGETEWVLRIGDASIAYRAPEMTKALSASSIGLALGGSRPSEADAVVERATAIDGWQVPVSAVHTDATGDQCVFRRHRSSTGYAAVHVDLQRGDIGTARVIGALRSEDAILINSSAVAGDAECD